MNNLISLFLSQAYKDCWEDYKRSLTSTSFPHWDYVILTASNEQQAEGFRKQLDIRKKYLPKETKFVVIPDEGGVRVGSGGATLSVIRWQRTVRWRIFIKKNRKASSVRNCLLPEKSSGNSFVPTV